MLHDVHERKKTYMNNLLDIQKKHFESSECGNNTRKSIDAIQYLSGDFCPPVFFLHSTPSMHKEQ